MMNNLLANYEKILEVLRKISPDKLLAIQQRTPKLSDLELIALSLSSEYMGIDSECDLFRKLPGSIADKICNSFDKIFTNHNDGVLSYMIQNLTRINKFMLNLTSLMSARHRYM